MRSGFRAASAALFCFSRCARVGWMARVPGGDHADKMGRWAIHSLRVSMNYFFWLLLNIGVPLFGPIAMLATVAVSYGKTTAKRLIFESVKDGQLFWSAIAISAAAVYEVIVALDREVAHSRPATSDGSLNIPHWALQVFLFAFIVLAFLGSLFVLASSLKKLDRACQTSTSPAILQRDAKVSIWLAATTTLCFAILHFLME
jgi:hypothetical protein